MNSVASQHLSCLVNVYTCAFPALCLSLAVHLVDHIFMFSARKKNEGVSEGFVNPLKHSRGPPVICGPPFENHWLTLWSNIFTQTLPKHSFIHWTKYGLARNFPRAWREVIVVAVLKQGKDASRPISNRPIALASCLMINRRLVYFLEYSGVLDCCQAGF